MKLTPMGKNMGMKNPYVDSMPSAAGLQEFQKPPVNLGAKPAPMYEEKPSTKPYQLPPAVDPKEEFFAANAQSMKPMKPDMYSMRRNRESDKMFQRQRMGAPSVRPR